MLCPAIAELTGLGTGRLLCLKAAGVLGRLTSAFAMQICKGKKFGPDPDSNSRPVARVSLSRWFVVLLAMLAALTALRCAHISAPLS